MCTVVRVISFPDASERRARFASSAPPKDKLDWEFFDADSSGDDGPVYSPSSALVSHGRELRRGEIGCFASHYRLWRDFLASGKSQLLVLEDDVFVDWPAVFPLIELDFTDRVDYLRLHAKRPAIAREIGWLCGRRVLHYLHYCYGTQAYLITRAGAEKFVAAAKVMDRPVDDFMDRSWHHGIPNLGIFPFPVIELEGASSIGGSERYATTPMDNVEKIKRISYRITDKISRLAHAARELSPVAEVSIATLQSVSPCVTRNGHETACPRACDSARRVVSSVSAEQP